MIDGLLGGLAVEDNRLDQGLRYPSRSKGAQDRAFGLKMWRPCDENDVCEGGAIVSLPPKPPTLRDACGLSSLAPSCSFPVLIRSWLRVQTPPEEAVVAKGMPADRFDRVRSTVRENIGWSLVMVTTHPAPTPDVVSRLVDGELACAPRGRLTCCFDDDGPSLTNEFVCAGLSEAILTDKGVVSVRPASPACLSWAARSRAGCLVCAGRLLHGRAPPPLSPWYARRIS